MRTKLTLELPDSPSPRYLRIARAIGDAVASGRLRAGDPLPSTRELARDLGVHRKTVLAAYEELRAQGLIETEPAKGTFVTGALPPLRPRRPSRTGRVPERRAAPLTLDLPPMAAPYRGSPRAPGVLLLLGGVPDLRFSWTVELGRAYARTLRRRDAHKLLDYGDPAGAAELRSVLARFLARERALTAPEDGIVVVRGALQGLYLAARALLRPGDRVAVEALSHPSAIGILRQVGARVEPIPIDADGLDVGELEARCARTRIRAVYLTPHHQLPTTVTLSPERRRRLLALARAREMLIFEDDYDHEFHYEGQPVLPLAAGEPGPVVYFGTFSKVLAPGLRLGFVAATPDIARQIARYRAFVDNHGDHVLERTIADLIDDGDLRRWILRARRVYQARRDALCTALREHLPMLEVTPPRGGMAMWLRAPGVDTAAWAARAYDAGVAFQPGSLFCVESGPSDRLRVGFAACTPRELTVAVERMKATFAG